MSIASKLEYLDGTKDYIRQCIQQKGVTVPDGTTFRQYGDKILEIETASETPPVTSVLQEGVATATGQQFDLLPSEGYDGFSKVAVTGDFNLKPENIAYGITIYGVTGTMEFKPTVAGSIPTAYQSYFDKARELYTGDYKNLMILESDQAVAFGFMLDGFNVETFNDETSEFTASKWIYVAYNKSKNEWKVEDWTDSTSNGGSFIKNIRYSDTYIYYQEGTPSERLLYPFLVGPEPPEQLPQIFSFVIKVPRADFSVRISYVGYGTIDWGDGTIDELVKVTANTEIPHTYAVAGEYTITFNGVFSGIVGGTSSFIINNYITRITTKFPTTIKDASYFGYGSEITELPENLFNGCSSLKTLYGAFYGSTSLTTIPENIFYGCGSLTNLTYIFHQCKALRSIPSALLMPLDSLTTMYYSFAECVILETIPVNLFANSRLLKNLQGAFSGCTAITVIPTGLFDNCQSLSNVSYCFNGTSITSIPENLFDNCQSLSNVMNCFNGTRITSIPENLFNTPNLVNASYCFAKISTLKSIPSGLFRNCPKIQDLSYCFNGCNGVQSISESILDGIPKDAPLNLRNMFERCSGVKTISPNLLDGFTNIQNIQSMFAYLTTYTGALPELWNDSRFDTVTHTKCFIGCTQASNYADVPDGWK